MNILNKLINVFIDKLYSKTYTIFDKIIDLGFKASTEIYNYFSNKFDASTKTSFKNGKYAENPIDEKRSDHNNYIKNTFAEAVSSLGKDPKKDLIDNVAENLLISFKKDQIPDYKKNKLKQIITEQLIKACSGKDPEYVEEIKILSASVSNKSDNPTPKNGLFATIKNIFYKFTGHSSVDKQEAIQASLSEGIANLPSKNDDEIKKLANSLVQEHCEIAVGELKQNILLKNVTDQINYAINDDERYNIKQLTKCLINPHAPIQFVKMENQPVNDPADTKNKPSIPTSKQPMNKTTTVVNAPQNSPAKSPSSSGRNIG